MRIGFVSTHASTFLKTFAASSRYCCSVRMFRPRSLPMIYLETAPWFGTQHASWHTNRPFGLQGVMGELNTICRLLIVQVM